MSIEERLESLERRMRAAEDQLEIIRLLSSYGPFVDAGESQAAAHLWVEGGVYDVGGAHRIKAYDDIAAIYDGEGHRNLINTGVSHLISTPRITLNGNDADAITYSFVVLKEGERWIVWRASANHFSLTRAEEGWRVVERYNRVLDGSKESHETLRRALPP